uniref:DDE-1 domain-containing protein n=1 Tax=Timema douglasi TaxID=61478 RepID=A0A7R8VE02_TIMDO|nr:unnamed protein product [Timema douglasi]
MATPSRCELNCRAVGFRFYATLNQTVVDGTPCRGDFPGRWVCVSDMCKVARMTLLTRLSSSLKRVSPSSHTDNIVGILAMPDPVRQIAQGLLRGGFLPARILLQSRGCCCVLCGRRSQRFRRISSVKYGSTACYVNKQWSGRCHVGGQALRTQHSNLFLTPSLTGTHPRSALGHEHKWDDTVTHIGGRANQTIVNCNYFLIVISVLPRFLTMTCQSPVIMASKTRAVLDLNTRVKIMKKSSLGKTQMYEIIKKKTEMLKLCAKVKNYSVSGPMIQEYAKYFAQKLSFRKIHRIVLTELCGKSNDVNSETIKEWVATLPFIIEGYEPKTIASGYETGLFFRALPNNSLCLKGEMEKPLVIDKAAKLRWFINMDKRKLPVEWKYNKKAWMASQIMEELLTAFNDRMKKQNSYVLLFLDNITCHPHIELSKCDFFGSLQTPQVFLNQWIRAPFRMLKCTIAKVFLESWADKRVNCVQKTLFDYRKKIKTN